MAVEHVFVVGAGLMGAGIAQLCAQQGIRATLCDLTEEIVLGAKEKVSRQLQGRVEKGKLSAEERAAILDRIGTTVSLHAASQYDFVIEVAPEDIEVKKEIFSKLDKVSPPQAILASNTTALSISEMGSATRRPERVIGMHFFNHPVVMKLVEIVPGILTSKETIEKARQFALALGKTPIVAQTESPGGIVSRILAGLLNEAVLVLEAGVASAEEIDTAMRLGANLPMGPLALLDLIGLDVHQAKMETLYRELSDPRYRTPYLIRKMVKAGHLGVKARRGFYEYPKEG